MSILTRVKSRISRMFVGGLAGLRRFRIWPSGLPEVDWGFVNGQAFVDEGFEGNAIIYSAIMFKVRTAYQAELRAYTGTRDKPELLPETHELSRLLATPNPDQSFAELQAEALVNFNVFGNAYVWFRYVGRGEFPEAFYTFRADWVYHAYSNTDNTLLGFVYAPPGVALEDGLPLLATDTMHVRLPNLNDWRAGLGKGLSPLVPASRPADVDNAATAFIKRFFDAGTMPRGLLSIEAPITSEIADASKERWMETYGGSENWLEPVVLGRGATYQRISATFDELGMVDLDARNESRMTMVLGVPLNLIESRPQVVQGTYSNKETDYRMFLDTVLIPELRMFEQEWRASLKGKTAFAQYDFSKVPGFLKREARLKELMTGWEKSAVTRAEVRQMLGLETTDEDNVYYIPTPMVVLSPAKASPVEPSAPIQHTTPDPKAKKFTTATNVTQGILVILSAEQEAAYRDKSSVSWEAVSSRILPMVSEEDTPHVKSMFAEALADGWSVGKMMQEVRKCSSL